MMFSSNSFRVVLLLAAVCNAVTSSHVGNEPPVDLGTAEEFAILAKTGISTVPESDITGDIGVSPIAGEAMTGFSFTKESDGQSSRSSQINGEAYAANYAVPTPERLTTAVGDMETAYTDAAGRHNEDASRINLGGGTLGGDFGGQTAPLTAGVYTFGSGVIIADTIYFDGEADPNSVFIIQMTGNLVQYANKDVILVNGAVAKNIFWQIAGNVEVGAGAHLEGILLVKTELTFITDSSLTGRVLTQTACNLQKATIDEPSEESSQRSVVIYCDTIKDDKDAKPDINCVVRSEGNGSD
jgi:hypothetical protein